MRVTVEKEANDSRTIKLHAYLNELVQLGYLYHDRSKRTYVLTDAGGRHLTALESIDGIES